MQNCPLARENEFSKIIELAELKEGELVCDVPAGGCYLASFLQEKVRLISVETSLEFIKCAEPSSFQERILCEDLGAIPLKSNQVDKMISLTGLHHLKSKRPFYKEAFRLLKSRGVLSMADVRVDSDVDRFLNVFVHENSSMGHTGDFIDAGTGRELEEAGFHVQYSKSDHFSWKFNSQESMVDFYQLLFGIDLADHQKILDGVRKYLGFFRENGKFCVNWELFYFKAVKP
jgi:SAM-dependent methyltransferase